MSAVLAERWRTFWHAPGSALNLAVARVVLAATALWLVLSRWDLPSVLEFPAEVWSQVTAERRARFMMVFGPGVERVLYALLHVSLTGALLGLFPRLSCFASGVLLYHFAPFETLIRTPNPYLRGLTIPTLGLLILSFAPCGDRLRLVPSARADREPADYTWPLRLVQVLLCQIYLFAGYAKLFESGLAWLTADNIRGWLLTLNQGLAVDPPSSWGAAVAEVPAACAAIAWGGIVFELAFPLVLFSRAARRVILPVAVLFHVANAVLFRIVFQNLPLLLLFVDWDGLRARRRR